MSAILLAAMLLTAEPANPTATDLIQSPRWLRLPSGSQFAAVYPKRAGGEDGKAVIICAVKADGHMEACRIDSETPADIGFGEAALKLARYFVMAKTTEQGGPVAGGVVRIPIVFRQAR